MRIDYHKGIDNPELIAICTACENTDCDKVCNVYAEKWLDIYMPDVKRKRDEQRHGTGNVRYMGKIGQTMMFSDGNETHSIAEWAEIIGISYVAMWKRLTTNNQYAFSPPEGIPSLRGRVKPLTAFGRTMTRAEWSAESGIPACTITGRITHYGWTVEDAVSIPVIRPIRRLYRNGKKEVCAENKSVDGTGSEAV